MNDTAEATCLALECLDHAEALAVMWGKASWPDIRVKAESLFPFLAMAQAKIKAIEPSLPDGCPEVQSLKYPPLPGQVKPWERRVTAHGQAVALLMRLVAGIDRGGVTSQSPYPVFDRMRPWQPELPAGWEVLREWIVRESTAASGQDSENSSPSNPPTT